MQYFYDSQVRRFVQQFAAIFSQVDVQYGSDPQGNPILHRVPVVFGNASRQAAAIRSDNSPNKLLSAPLISIYITGLEYDQKRTQDPTFLDKTTVRQRYYNQDTGQYETTQGNAFTVQRLMPVPYTLRLAVDIWATSEQQRLEIIEQLGILFNPSLDIRSNDNFVDWSNLSVVYQDGLSYNNKSIPQGTGNPIEVTNWKFWMPIWISGPIKVSKLGIIQKIISTIHKGSTLVDIENQDLLLGQRQKITPYGYQVLLVGNKLQILPASTPSDDNSDFDVDTQGPNTEVYWNAILNVYGKVRPGVTQIALENEFMGTEIVGTIDYDPDDDRLLTYTIDTDTLPQDTILPVDSVIDPNVKYPGGLLPADTVGQRYLIVSDIAQQRERTLTSNLVAWKGLTEGAGANDIIEYGTITTSHLTLPSTLGSTQLHLKTTNGIWTGYTVTFALNGTSIGTVLFVDHDSGIVTLDTPLAIIIKENDTITFSGTGWGISYDATATSNTEYVTNLTTNIQYRINGGVWRQSYTGYYDAGQWRVII
jgi:hypothetical protein